MNECLIPHARTHPRISVYFFEGFASLVSACYCGQNSKRQRDQIQTQRRTTVSRTQNSYRYQLYQRYLAFLAFLLVLVLSFSKYCDPLHVILEYIAEVRAVKKPCKFGANADSVGATQLRYSHRS